MKIISIFGILCFGFSALAEPVVEYRPAVQKSGERVLKVKLESSSRCFFGDLDTVLLDLRQSKGNLALQLSVEPLPLGSGSIYYGEPLVKNDNNKENLGAYEVAIPNTEKAHAFLVQLCSIAPDDSPQQPCSKLDVVDLNEAMLPYRVDSASVKSSEAASLGSDADFIPKPKTYYSQLLFSNKVGAFGVTNLSLEFDTLESHFSAEGISLNTSKAIYADFEKYDHATNSMPLKLADKEIVVSLPYFDSARCGGK